MRELDCAFRDLAENSTDLMYSISPDGHLLYANRAWLSDLGYEREELETLRFLELVRPDRLEECRRALTRATKADAEVRLQTALRAKDGRSIEIEGSLARRLVDGRLESIRGIFREVAERRHSEAELDKLFHLSLDLLCVAGFDGYFKKINPSFTRVLGYETEELLSRAFIEFVHPHDKKKTLAEVENLSRGDPTVHFENRYRAKDGRYRWLAWTAAPLPEQGLIYAVGRDVTEHKLLEELSERQAHELERSNADLEQFASIASHDLRAPLRGIENLSEWIMEDLPEDLPEPARVHLEQLRRRVRRMQALTDDLLMYSRAALVPQGISRVDTAALVDEMTALLGPREGFEIVAEGPMPILETAKAPLEQVLRNLIGNALKHHDRERGRVTVSVREVAGVYEFRVADDGPGVPEDSRSHVFQMFQRLESHDRIEGSGIGLALVKRLVERAGGRVWIESALTRGSVFCFTWPARIADHEEAHAETLDRG